MERLEVAAGALGTAVPAVAAPRELGARIRGTVHAEAELLRAAGPQADRPSATRARFGGGRLALAAALATGVLCGLPVGATLLGGSGSDPRVIRARILEPDVAPGARGTLTISGGRATLAVTRMPRLTGGRVYEVWLIGSGRAPRPTDALFGVDAQGSGTAAVPGSLRGVRELLVTAEPAGGSQLPTRAPILAATTTT